MPDWRRFSAYLAKRRTLFQHQVNLLEIDLLLGGDRLKMLEPLPAGDYYAFLTRAPLSRECDVYGWSVRAPLPTIPVPLKQADGEIALGLQTVFARTYENGRFDLVVGYRDRPAALTEADQVWANELIQSLSN